MELGVLRQELKALSRALLKMGHIVSEETVIGLLNGDPQHFMAVFVFIFEECGEEKRKEISLCTHDTIFYDLGSKGKKGIDTLYKILKNYFKITPVITPHQFLLKKFAIHKVRLCLKVVDFFRAADRKKQQLLRPSIEETRGEPRTMTIIKKQEKSFQSCEKLQLKSRAIIGTEEDIASENENGMIEESVPRGATWRIINELEESLDEIFDKVKFLDATLISIERKLNII